VAITGTDVGNGSTAVAAVGGVAIVCPRAMAEVGIGDSNGGAGGADGTKGVGSACALGTCSLTRRMNTAIASAIATARSLRK
jgi:hypothetical protein